MTDMQQYVVEEWAEEYRQGRLDRREFLRRMALMSGGVAFAVPVLGSLGVTATQAEIAEAASAGPPVVAQASGVTVSPDDPALEASMTSFPSGTIQVIGYLARPKDGGPYPAVLIIHENRGLLDHFKDVARRLAKSGYVGFALDLLSPEGGTAKFGDLAQATTALAQTPPERHVETMSAAVRHLQGLPFIRRDRIGTVGFCFGGGMVWRLATSNSDLRAAVPFYGPNPPLTDVAKIKAAVLAIYGELDNFIDPGIPAIREAMQNAHIVFDIIIYPGARHAFFNDTGQSYNENAAKAAWVRTLAWFDQYLRGA
ncbi:MAG TPA: dienelactone hydrolase family protein [archaeon]|nr:dienelactone hydrolase family protein [archaeon]